MAVRVPTTQEQFDLLIALLERNINQTIPANTISFGRVLAAMMASGNTGLYRFGVDRALQNLALTATGDDLERIGANYGVFKKAATQYIGEIEATGTDTTPVPAGSTVWIADATGYRYTVNTTVVVAGGKAEMEVTAQTPGADPNLDPGRSSLTIDTPISGLATIALCTDNVTLGTDREDEEVYRRRVLNEIRTVGGGGNAVDYRTWAEATAGCRRAYPYTGSPLALVPTPLPGDRSIFVEATTDIDPDGIAPQSLLDDVRDNINYDPITGNSRPSLGDTDATLWVESITRRSFYNQVVGLVVDPAYEVDLKADIDTALEFYYDAVIPYLPAVDAPITKNDVVTKMSISEVVQDVLKTYGATASEVNFGLVLGVYTYDTYTLAQGELGKNGGVVYA